MKRLLAIAALLLVSHPGRSDQTGVYRVAGQDARLFDQYDNDGYSLSVSSAGAGELELTVRVSDAPLASVAPFPTGVVPDASLPFSAERDQFARRLVAGSRRQAQAVERLLVGLAGFVRHDPDRTLRQDPAAVFAARRAHCVGLAELAVDLLRRVGIRARTVQGVLRNATGEDGHDPSLGGAYHRWIEVHYPDRGFVFSDPRGSINGVDARYIPFGHTSLARPRSLSIRPISLSGRLLYSAVATSEGTLRVRPSTR